MPALPPPGPGPPPGRPLDRRTLQKWTRRWGTVAEVPGCTPHRFRHAFGTALLEATQDLRLVQEAIERILGPNVNCDDVGNRVDGGWYQVGQGRDNNSIYERRVRDSNGNLVIQRARRNSNGSFTIISTRRANDNDKQWQKAQRQRQKEIRKEQHEQDKEYRKSQHDNDDDNRQVVRGDDRSYVASNAEGKGNGHGKDKGKHKGKD